MSTILHIDSSGRIEESVSRLLSAELVETLKSEGDEIIRRDLSESLPQVDEVAISVMLGSRVGNPDDRNEIIELSDQLVSELQQADTFVIGLPIYNFSMPASFKAWADLVARTGLTFEYTEQGPVGLLAGKKAFIIITSGGTPIGSPMDHCSDWIQLFLGFLGITDIQLIAADGLLFDFEGKIKSARASFQEITAHKA